MRNRVTPLGDLVAIELRGAWTGNRGSLHQGTEVARFHRSQLWITCALAYRDWKLPQWAPGRFTVLFFHDEAVSFAAGHRPCALCRRPAYNAYRQTWATGLGVAVPRAAEIDHQLHGERIVRGTHRRQLHRSRWPALPAGTFVLTGDEPALVLDDAIVPWTIRGYSAARARPAAGPAEVITPPSTVAALRAGYPPQIDPAATTQLGCAPDTRRGSTGPRQPG